ncbi:helicase DnaB [Xylanibacillus composti]|uniref:Helicase DnaB n=1 Tax=Xylanibacillus composti TaxID=1572762 RepID=A0A8J4H4M7_9BACL|nr:DnaD domain protein [Xylanibacillus composti]MDT9723500.1 helicase DnaB [Xylanibacillus composti]GIQ68463.1 hypothetical protein XYCOK13_12870 [Xylanibacillus composti]
MKLTNGLDFTEHHRFVVFRDFSIGAMDETVLQLLYQPMIGSGAVSFYRLLHRQLPADRVGYSHWEVQRKLFLLMHVDPSDKGRRQMADGASRLEAVGLLQTKRLYIAERDEFVYLYLLLPPLQPYEFFRNQHLTLLLQDKVGKQMLLAIQSELCVDGPPELAGLQLEEAEDVSVPFYEWFELNLQAEEPDLAPPPPAPGKREADAFSQGEYRFADIIMRFPRDSANRPFVERLEHRSEELTAVNFIARKYKLSLPDTCRLLDEEGIFSSSGELQVEAMQAKAYGYFRQTVKRAQERERVIQRIEERREPQIAAAPEKDVDEAFYLEVPEMLRDHCSISQYNHMLRNSPHTEVLERFFPGAVPGHVLNIFDMVDRNYKLQEEVINVLIHYLKTEQLSWNKPFIDSIAADWLGKQIDSYEKAVTYLRSRQSAGESKPEAAGARSSGSRKRFGGSAQQKPKIPTIQHEPGKGPEVSDEELERILEKVRQRRNKS